jgi:hypothetical protein
VDPAWKPGVSQVPSVAVDTSASNLPDTNRQDVREAIRAVLSSPYSGSLESGSYQQQRPEGTHLNSSHAYQVLMAILRDTGNVTFNPSLDGGGRYRVGSDPFIEAIRRLGLHGALPPVEGLGKIFGSSPTSIPTSSQGSIYERTNQTRQHHQSAPRERDKHTSGEKQGEEPLKRESVAKEPVLPEGSVQPRTESPAEQRVREALEKAIARFQERTTEVPASSERAIPPSPLGPTTSEPSPSHITAPSFTQREQGGRNPETILSPQVREALNDPRNDTARLLQQILASDLSPTRLVALQPSGLENVATQTINPFLTAARDTVQERLTQLRDALQVTIERSSPQPPTSPDRVLPVSQASMHQGDFARVVPTSHHPKPQVTIQAEERATRDPLHARAMGAIRPVGEPRSERLPPVHDKANSLLDAMSKTAQRILSLHTLRKIEYASETAVITAAAAIALGVIGGDLVLKEILTLGQTLLKRIRGEKSHLDERDEAAQELEDTIQELERAFADRGVEAITHPSELVADIPGVVVAESTGLPIEGIEIDGGLLGIVHTNANGEFIFKNVPLDSGFTITAKRHGHSFFPCPAVGTVSATTRLSIFCQTA